MAFNCKKFEWADAKSDNVPSMNVKVGERYKNTSTEEVIKITELCEKIGAVYYEYESNGENHCLSEYALNMLFDRLEPQKFVNQYDEDIRNFFKPGKHNEYKGWAIKRDKK